LLEVHLLAAARATSHFLPELEQRYAHSSPLRIPDSTGYERVYALPHGLILEPRQKHRITGWVQNGGKTVKLFRFDFFSDARGCPAAY
jgi:hypothetical protein